MEGLWEGIAGVNEAFLNLSPVRKLRVTRCAAPQSDPTVKL